MSSATAPPTHRYVAFGRQITSEIPLPELTSGIADGVPYDGHIFIRQDKRPAPSLQSLSDEPAIAVDAVGVTMSFPGAGRFLLDLAHNTIWFSFGSENRELLRLPLLGPVIATYLHASGSFVLHASAVTTPFGAVAFLGDKGAGKSTTAAAFIRQGLQLLTDDLLVCGASANGLGEAYCESSFAQLKLTPQAAAALRLEGATELPPPFPTFPKIQQRLPEGSNWPRRPRLAFVCELQRGHDAEVVELNAAASMAMLLRYAYTLRYGKQFVQGLAGVSFFRNAAELASSTRSIKMTVPSKLDLLDLSVPLLLDRLAMILAEAS